MTASSGLRARRDRPGGKPDETALSWAAVAAAAGAVFAWAACCVPVSYTHLTLPTIYSV